MDRRDFIKAGLTAAGTVAGAALVGGGIMALSGARKPKPAELREFTRGKFKLRFYPYELQLAHSFTVSSYSRTTTPGVQLELEYGGVTGYGEASMPQYLGHSVGSVCDFLSRIDLSAFNDPFCSEDILDYVDSLSEGDGPAKAAFDIALHDLLGKLVGQPLYRLWGYNPSKAGATSFTIGIDTPQVVREKTLECADRFRILKIKVGLDSDEQMIRTIREITDLPLVVDANQGWKDRYKALDEIFWLHEQGVQMVEQPMAVDALDDIAWISERSPVPIFADEACQVLRDIPRLKGAYHGVNIKLMKSGGLREARRMISYARAEGMKVMLGCMTETSCACTAVAQLSPAADFCDIDGNLLITNDLFEGMVVRDGLMVLPEGAGLGLRKL